MRFAGILIVALAAALSTGGVNTQFCSEENVTCAAYEAPASPEQTENRMCSLDSPTRTSLSFARPERENDRLVFSLDRLGYNYARPGEYRPTRPGVPASPAR